MEMLLQVGLDWLAYYSCIEFRLKEGTLLHSKENVIQIAVILS